MKLLKKQKIAFEGGGLVLFLAVEDALKTEKVLKLEGYQVKLVAPPPELRKGCDLAVEINLVEKPGIERALDNKDIPYVSILPIKGSKAKILEVVKVTDFGQWIMVRAGNMKITYEKSSGIIVNISGGGCPDIPYLHTELIDKQVDKAPRPKDFGFTLCALNLDRALDECLTLYSGGNQI